MHGELCLLSEIETVLCFPMKRSVVDRKQSLSTLLPRTGAQFDKSSPGWKSISRCAMLCARAEFKGGQESVPILKRECVGDASETAILKCMELTVGNVMTTRGKNKKVCEIPFNSTNKFHVSTTFVTTGVLVNGDLTCNLMQPGDSARNGRPE